MRKASTSLSMSTHTKLLVRVDKRRSVNIARAVYARRRERGGNYAIWLLAGCKINMCVRCLLYLDHKLIDIVRSLLQFISVYAHSDNRARTF